MSKKLLSFLGTNYYIRTIYTMKDKESTPHRFIQASLAELICKDWGKEDSIHIFLTKESEDKNWNKTPKNFGEIQRQKEYDWEHETYKGLYEVLESLKLPFNKENIISTRVPEGWKEKEKWEIFNKIVDQINDNDEIYFDMTHSFRYLPMLAIIALNYIRVVKKNIKIKGIYYGAFEAIGPAYQVKVLPVEQRKAPVFDLIGFENLMRWTAGVDRFVGTGDASILSGLVKEKELGEDSPEKKLVENMEKFGKIMATCRGRKIGEGAKAVKDSIEEFKGSLGKERKPGMSPLVHLLGKVEDKMNGFENDDIKNGLEAVKWCLEHNMTQQGYTILEELIITFIAKQYYKDKPKKVYEEQRRIILSKIIYVICNSLPEEKWDKSLQREENIKKIEQIKKHDNIMALGKLFYELAEYRNDIDHSGCREKPKTSSELITELKNYFKQVRDFI